MMTKFLLALLFIAQVATAPVLAADHVERILFVGNSFTYYNSLPAMVLTLVKNGTGKAPMVGQVVKGGWSLPKHWQDHEVEKVLANNGPFDWLVLQDHSGSCKDPTAMSQAVGQFKQLADKTNTKCVLYETWSDAGKATDQIAITDAYKASSKKWNIPLVPVGDAFLAAAKSHPEIQLYVGDKHHPSTAGSYLAACLFYKFFTGKSPVGLPVLQDVTQNEADALQGVAASF